MITSTFVFIMLGHHGTKIIGNNLVDCTITVPLQMIANSEAKPSFIFTISFLDHLDRIVCIHLQSLQMIEFNTTLKALYEQSLSRELPPPSTSSS